MCKVIRFYGFTEEYINELPVEKYWMYLRSMHKISAQEDLMELKIACAPHLKQSSRKKLFSALEKAAMETAPRALDMNDLAELINE